MEKQHGNITVYKMKLIHVILTILKKKANLYKMKIIQLSKEKINSIEKHPKTIKKTQKQPRPLHFAPSSHIITSNGDL